MTITRRDGRAEREWFKHYHGCPGCWDLDASRCPEGDRLWREFMHERGYTDTELTVLLAE